MTLERVNILLRLHIPNADQRVAGSGTEDETIGVELGALKPAGDVATDLGQAARPAPAQPEIVKTPRLVARRRRDERAGRVDRQPRHFVRVLRERRVR